MLHVTQKNCAGREERINTPAPLVARRIRLGIGVEGANLFELITIHLQNPKARFVIRGVEPAIQEEAIVIIGDLSIALRLAEYGRIKVRDVDALPRGVIARLIVRVEPFEITARRGLMAVSRVRPSDSRKQYAGRIDAFWTAKVNDRNTGIGTAIVESVV